MKLLESNGLCAHWKPPSKPHLLMVFCDPTCFHSSRHGLAKFLILVVGLNVQALRMEDDPRRKAANDAWVEAAGDKRRALEILRQDPRAAGCSRPDRWILRWGYDYYKRRSFQDSARSGRPKQLSDAAAQQAATIIKAGFLVGSIKGWYSSLTQALEDSEQLRDILSTAGITRKHLLQRIKKVDPDVVYGMLHVKAAFTNDEKYLRIKVSKQLIRMFTQAASLAKRVFWVDAKKMHVSLDSQQVWFDSEDKPDTVEDVRAQGARGRLKTLHFYAAVNACGGPVHLVFITGTTGLQRSPPYRVRPQQLRQFSDL